MWSLTFTVFYLMAFLRENKWSLNFLFFFLFFVKKVSQERCLTYCMSCFSFYFLITENDMEALNFAVRCVFFFVFFTIQQWYFIFFWLFWLRTAIYTVHIHTNPTDYYEHLLNSNWMSRWERKVVSAILSMAWLLVPHSKNFFRGPLVITGMYKLLGNKKSNSIRQTRENKYCNKKYIYW